MSGSGRLRCIVVGETTLPERCAEILIEEGQRVVALVTVAPEARAWADAAAVPIGAAAAPDNKPPRAGVCATASNQ